MLTAKYLTLPNDGCIASICEQLSCSCVRYLSSALTLVDKCQCTHFPDIVHTEVSSEP
jgi:hypothetical protein